jgi:hypothetical protein
MHVSQGLRHLASASSLVLVLQALSYLAEWDIQDQSAKDALNQTVKKLIAQVKACPAHVFNTKVSIQFSELGHAQMCCACTCGLLRMTIKSFF